MQEYKWDGKIYEYGSAILKQKTELVINDKQLRLNLVEILKCFIFKFQNAGFSVTTIRYSIKRYYVY